MLLAAQKPHELRPGLFGAFVWVVAGFLLSSALTGGLQGRPFAPNFLGKHVGSSKVHVPAPKMPQALLRQARLAPPWPPLLTDDDVARGEAYYGTGTRLRRVAAKLLAGQPIKAYTLGGSVTLGVGAPLTRLAYASRFFDLINASFPHRGHVFSNKGVSGTGSGIFAACLDRMVPRDADLVVVEFTVNEPEAEPFTAASRRRYEQLLRKLLKLGSDSGLAGNGNGGSGRAGGSGINSSSSGGGGGGGGSSPAASVPGAAAEGAAAAGVPGGGSGGGPAVIILHHYHFLNSFGDGMDVGSYYRTAEAQLGVFANYYDLPSVSIRNAFYPLMAAGVDGFRVDRVISEGTVRTRPGPGAGPVPQAEPGKQWRYFYSDLKHPSITGHTALAEALAGPLRRALAEELAGGQLSGIDDSSSGSSSSGRRRRRQDARLEGLPPSMVPNNTDTLTTVCALQEDFKPYVQRHSPGFEYRAEWPDKPTFIEQKWGWTGFRPGEWAELVADSRTPTGGLASVSLVYLRSYEHMGTARVKCSGCTCKGSTIDGTWHKPVSLMQHHSFKVTQHERCTIRVTIAEEAGENPSGGHKVKLMALIVSSFELKLGVLSGNYELAARHAQGGA